MQRDAQKIIENHNVPLDVDEQRLQEYAVGIFQTISSRKGIKKAIKKGLITVNGRTGSTGDWIKGGEELAMLQQDLVHKPLNSLPLNILYEDSHLAVVNKPSGILVSGNKHRTIENALSSNLTNSQEPDVLPISRPVHRLDFPTSGALLIAKTTHTLSKLKAMFENRKVEKTYHAVTVGAMEDSGEITSEIDGKKSRSEYKKLDSISSENYKFLNLVQLTPHTGRRHQLRKHLLEIGNPILGDPLYKLEKDNSKGGRLYLHATSLAFQHPVTNESLELFAPYPKKFLKLFPSLGNRVSD